MTVTLRLLSKFILRDLRTSIGRSIITIIGIALGVAVFLSISIANGTALLRFKDTVNDIAGKANIELRPASGRYMDEEVLADIRWLWMVDGKFTPIVRADVITSLSEPEVVQFIGIDILADRDFGWYMENASEAVQPTSEPIKGDPPDLNSSAEEKTKRGVADTSSSIENETHNASRKSNQTSKLTILSPNAVFIGDRLAKEEGEKLGRGPLKPGMKLPVIVDDRLVDLSIAGLLSGDGLGGAYSGSLIVADLPLAQETLGIGDQVSQVEIIVPADKVDETIEKLSSQLGPAVVAERSTQRNEKVEKMTRSFEYNLWALTLIALVVGMFLIYNTMMISVIRRRPDIGTLRALGVSRYQVFFIMIAEASLMGALGSALGVVCGILMANWSLNAVAQTFQRLYFRIPLDSITIEPSTAGLAFLTGMIFTLVAAVPPAAEAASVTPAEATNRHSVELKIQRWSPAMSLAGIFVLAMAGYFSMLPALDNLPIYGYFSAILCVAGFALIMPMLLRACFGPLNFIAKSMFGLDGKVAINSLKGSLGRVSVAVASLTVGIAMMASLAIMIGSFRQTVTAWVDQTFKADLWVQPAGRMNGSKDSVFRINPEDAILKIAGVKAVEPWIEVPVEVDGLPAILGGARFEVLAKHGNLSFLSGRPSIDVCKTVIGNRAIVSESFALKHRINAGDEVSIKTKFGKLAVEVADVYYDYASDLGYIVLPRSLFQQYTGIDSVSSLAVHIADSADSEVVRRRIMSSVGSKSLLRIKTTRELRKAVLDIFDRTFAITYALHTIAIAVAILSIMNALLALIYESRREFGILTYIGMSASRVRNIVLIDAGVMGILGYMFGLVLGFLLALLLIYVINKQSFGWTVRFDLPVEFFFQSFFIVIITAVAAGIVPARLVAKMKAPEALRQE